MAGKKNLLLAFDAFGTLYKPNVPIPQAYGKAALRHGIRCAPQKPDDELTLEDFQPVKKAFSRAFKDESAQNPNYGRATGLGAEKWWANVIRKTFQPFLNHGQEVSQELVTELLSRYSTCEGYTLFPDVLPFFQMLKNRTIHSTNSQNETQARWPWDRTVVGIISNSDDRVPSILESFGLKIGPRRVGKRIAQANLDNDIDFVVLSYDVGFEKPDCRMFHAATQMLQSTLPEASHHTYRKLYVGDSLEHDYVGAKGSGWDAVLVDRSEASTTGVQAGSNETQFSGLYKDERSVAGAMKRVEVCSNLAALAGWQPHRYEDSAGDRS